MDLTAASAEEVNDLTNLPPLDLNKTPRASCKNCGATLAGAETAVGLCPLCQDDGNGGRPHRQRQRQRLMRTIDGRTVTGAKAHLPCKHCGEPVAIRNHNFGSDWTHIDPDTPRYERQQCEDGQNHAEPNEDAAGRYNYDEGDPFSWRHASYDDDFIHADDDPVHGRIHPDVCPGCRIKYPHGNGEVCPTCQDEIIGSHGGEFDRRKDAETAAKPLMERTVPIEHSTNGPAVMDMSRGKDDHQDPYERKIREHIGPRPPGLVPQVDHVQYGTPYTLWQHQLPTHPSDQHWLRRSLNALEDTLQTEADRGGSDNRISANHPVTDIDRVLSNPRKKVRTGPYAGEHRLGRNLTARMDPSTGDRVVRLHDTDIVRHHPNGDVTYNTGGYATQTTRAALDQWGDPHHSFSQSRRMMYLHDRHPDVSTTEHVDTQWGGYDRVQGQVHDFHDGMRMGGASREPDYSNAHPHQAEAAPRGHGIWGRPYPDNHVDRHTQGAGRTVTPVDTRSYMDQMSNPSPYTNHDDLHRMFNPTPRAFRPFGEDHGTPGANYSRERDRRELADADSQRPEEGDYSGFTHRQPSREVHPAPNEFDVHQHLDEHHGYGASVIGDMAGEHAVKFHEREHTHGPGMNPHTHDDPMNDEAPPLPGEHFDDYNKRMNERQVQRMKQRGIEAKVVREIANTALRSDPSLSRQAALVIGNRAIERFPALVERVQR
jgi:hypothetical protein